MPAPVDPATGSAVVLAAFSTELPGGRAAVAVAAAMGQIGLPYVWGGEVATVGMDGDGLPLTSGLSTGGGRAVLRLAGPAAAAGAASGSAVTLRYSDGTSRAYTVRSPTPAGTAAEAAAALSAAPAGSLVVLVPAGEGGWTVLVAA